MRPRLFVVLGVAACVTGTGCTARTVWGADTPCGSRCLQLAGHLVGRRVPPDCLPAADAACSLLEIKECADGAGLSARAVELDPTGPQLAQLPLIVCLAEAAREKKGHFVVLFGRVGDKVQLIDAPHAPAFVPIDRLAKLWDGKGLYIASKDADVQAELKNDRAAWLVIVCESAVVICVVCLVMPGLVRARAWMPARWARRE